MSSSATLEHSDFLDLPRLPQGWIYRELGDLLQENGLSYGIVQPGADDPGGIPIVRVKNIRRGRVITNEILRVSKDIEKSYRRTRLQGGEVLLSLVGSVGEVAVAPTSIAGWNVARAVAVIRMADGVSSSWIAQFLSSDLAQQFMNIWQTTTVQATLNLRDLRRLPIAMPPKKEREAVSAVLVALDDKIAVNDSIVSTTNEVASAILEEILRDSVVSDVLLRDIAGVNLRKAVPVAGRTLRYIDISSVSVGCIEWPELTSWDAAPGRARRLISSGDTIWSTVRPNRKSFALILDDDPKLVASTGFAVLTPVKVGPAFLYEITKRDTFVQYLESVAEGSAYPAVRAERFERAVIPLPSPDRVETFEAITMPLRRRSHAAEVESRTLANLRDTLMPRLMSGEIRVREAEKVVEEVT